MRSFLILTILPFMVSAWTDNTLFARQTSNVTCETNQKVCGEFCIPSDYTCCPDLEGGCPAKSVCQAGDNGEYGCCPTGELCGGDGGSAFLNETSTNSSSSTSTTATDNSDSSTTATSSTGDAHRLIGSGLSFALIGAGIAVLL